MENLDVFGPTNASFETWKDSLFCGLRVGNFDILFSSLFIKLRKKILESVFFLCSVRQRVFKHSNRKSQPENTLTARFRIKRLEATQIFDLIRLFFIRFQNTCCIHQSPFDFFRPWEPYFLHFCALIRKT